MARGRLAAVAALTLILLTRCGQASAVPGDVLESCHAAISTYLIQPDTARYWNEAGTRSRDGWKINGLVEGVRHRSYVCRVSDGKVVVAHVS